MRRERAGLGLPRDLLCHGKAVEFRFTAPAEVDRSLEDRDLEREERAGLSSHVLIMGIYLPISQARTLTFTSVAHAYAMAVRLRHWLFDRGDNLAGAIYGTILVTSIIAAADSSDAIWQSLGIVEVTVAVFWLAHVYAHALAWSLDGNEKFSRRGLRPIARKEWPLLQAAVVPSLALLAGGFGLIATQTAYWIAIGYGVVMLISWGLIFARQERLSRLATCAVVLANAFFGLAIVLLKEFVNH